MGGTSGDGVKDIVVDRQGNVYTAGTFRGTADFNPHATDSWSMTSAGGEDAFVAKLNASGDFVWARQFGDTSSDSANGIALGGSDDFFYMVGHFSGAVDLDPWLGTANKTSAGARDMVFSKWIF